MHLIRWAGQFGSVCFRSNISNDFHFGVRRQKVVCFPIEKRRSRKAVTQNEGAWQSVTEKVADETIPAASSD
jgi:hypothetical protein